MKFLLPINVGLWLKSQQILPLSKSTFFLQYSCISLILNGVYKSLHMLSSLVLPLFMRHADWSLHCQEDLRNKLLYRPCSQSKLPNLHITKKIFDIKDPRHWSTNHLSLQYSTQIIGSYTTLPNVHKVSPPIYKE